MASIAGKDIYFYLADSGDVHIVELADVTLTLNDGTSDQTRPAGPATSEFWAKVSRGATEYGLRPRKVGVCFTTTAPAGLELGRTYNVPVLDPTFYNGITIGQNGNYQGNAVVVRSKQDEDIYPGI